MNMNSTNLLLFSIAAVFLILASKEASCRQIYDRVNTDQKVPEERATNLFSFITYPVSSAVSSVASGISSAVSAVVYVAQEVAHSIPLVGRWVPDPRIPNETPTKNPGGDEDSTTGGTGGDGCTKSGDPRGDGNKSEGRATHLFSCITDPVYNVVSFVVSGISSSVSATVYVAQKLVRSIPLVGRWVPDPRIPDETPAYNPGGGAESTTGDAGEDGLKKSGCAGGDEDTSEQSATNSLSFITDEVYTAVSIGSSVGKLVQDTVADGDTTTASTGEIGDSTKDGSGKVGDATTRGAGDGGGTSAKGTQGADDSTSERSEEADNSTAEGAEGIDGLATEGSGIVEGTTYEESGEAGDTKTEESRGNGDTSAEDTNGVGNTQTEGSGADGETTTVGAREPAVTKRDCSIHKQLRYFLDTATQLYQKDKGDIYVFGGLDENTCCPISLGYLSSLTTTNKPTTTTENWLKRNYPSC